MIIKLLSVYQEKQFVQGKKNPFLQRDTNQGTVDG